ncbi:hypothetical protein [Virgibacillus pantothenticus]|uniref:Uncharacterized protein n=1 Tax=Virgibacillus pantothenticus TaxID=1473 RepID=A0A0L0QM23_VIRPA|nr:hypothetical protein [Virgibacillus pantothenticus]KNE19670.1 hypothetical protein AFK71_14535 [Virgibacillus pantothenticus]MED3736624.1 hypothetical protein [Virgibacillus pantothenticus]QTY14801.1 hypothetical protein KBP50_12750 [Virgibacillus pantothenticus]SIS79593.1 hypothetical protein SAMN05421787_103281 [Virgibacillus pantothenticus]
MTAEAFDAKKELLTALKSSQLLIAEVVGGFHNLIAKHPNNEPIPFPRIVYQELRNDDDDFADNKPNSANVGFQVSIYCDSLTISKQSSIAKEVDEIMKSIGYVRYDSQDLYEEDTSIYHKPMRYSKKVF